MRKAAPLQVDVKAAFGLQILRIENNSGSDRFERPFKLTVGFDTDTQALRLVSRVNKYRQKYLERFPGTGMVAGSSVSYDLDATQGYSLLTLLRSHEFGLPTKDFIAGIDRMQVPCVKWKAAEGADGEVRSVRIYKGNDPIPDLYMRFDGSPSENRFRNEVFNERNIADYRIRLCQDSVSPMDDDPGCCFIEGRYFTPVADRPYADLLKSKGGVAEVLDLLQGEFGLPAQAASKLGRDLQKMTKAGIA